MSSPQRSVRSRRSSGSSASTSSTDSVQPSPTATAIPINNGAYFDNSTGATNNTNSNNNTVTNNSSAIPNTNSPSRPRHRRPRRARHHHTNTGTTASAINAISSSPDHDYHPFQPSQQTGGVANLLSASPSMSRRPGHDRFYGIQGLNLSNTSIESSTLLDHREQQYMRPRRSSTLGQAGGLSSGIRRMSNAPQERLQLNTQYGSDRSSAGRLGDIDVTTPTGHRQTLTTASMGRARGRRAGNRSPGTGSGGQGSPYDSGNEAGTENTRLIGGDSPRMTRGNSGQAIPRRPVTMDSGLNSVGGGLAVPGLVRDYGSIGINNINCPPSVPTSPRMSGSGEGMMLGGFLDGSGASTANADIFGQGHRRTTTGDAIIDIDQDAAADHSHPSSSPPSPGDPTITGPGPRGARADDDVCFPIDELADAADHIGMPGHHGAPRRHAREWPDLSVLEEWSTQEKEQRSEGIRAKKTSEPVYVGGRLRANLRQWHREEEEAPYRFTYFNDELPATIHAHTISELLLPGQTFADLFRPEPGKNDDMSESEFDEGPAIHANHRQQPQQQTNGNGLSNHLHGTSLPMSTTTQHQHHSPERRNGGGEMRNGGGTTEMGVGQRPTFWLDVLSPTDAEMKILTKAFGIHPLTAEDIMMQEAREKVELFRSYYLVSYKSFEQDRASEDYLDPVNMYVVVFREGVISFHFSMTPHPANVRRRIRQLKDYITVSADWISYALIDDITDAFVPLIQSIEDEVDDIDEQILQMHKPEPASTPTDDEKARQQSIWAKDPPTQDANMLRRVGDCRKKVMGLYRLLGNKADVIKGFAKRCNEQWEVAPRSEIGLYLGDIQDHIVTMVANLNHYEKILSRSHSNYLAQINIMMNERQEQTADVLGRLTVMGTIVLPMNIITGLWGMNVLVPGQDAEGLKWFWSITGSLCVFAVLCYLIAKRVYKIV